MQEVGGKTSPDEGLHRDVGLQDASDSLGGHGDVDKLSKKVNNLSLSGVLEELNQVVGDRREGVRESRGGAHAIGAAEAEAVGWASHQFHTLVSRRRQGLHALVELELHAVLDPLVVEGLRGLIQDQLEGGHLTPMSSHNLEEAGSPGFPKAFTKLAHVAPRRDGFLLAHDLPAADGGQDQAAFDGPPKHMLALVPKVLLLVVIASHRSDVEGGERGELELAGFAWSSVAVGTCPPPTGPGAPGGRGHPKAAMAVSEYPSWR
eukprot:s2373_g6.t1